MSKLRLKRPSPGTVLGTIALVVAVAGNANAFSAGRVIVRKGDIAKGAVTAKALAPGAVRAKALAKGAVSAKALKKGAVTAAALGPDAVTALALAPGSVYGGALGAVTVHSAAIADVDSTPHNGEWTASSTAIAACASGERPLSGGVILTNPGNNQVGIIQSSPVTSADTQGWAGRIASDSGGTAVAEVQVLCLK